MHPDKHLGKYLFLSYAAALLTGLVGIMGGSYLGDRLTPSLVFSGGQGYQAAGLLAGVILGSLAGVMAYSWLSRRRAAEYRLITIAAVGVLMTAFVVFLVNTIGGSVAIFAIALPMLAVAGLWEDERERGYLGFATIIALLLMILFSVAALQAPLTNIWQVLIS